MRCRWFGWLGWVLIGWLLPCAEGRGFPPGEFPAKADANQVKSEVPVTVEIPARLEARPGRLVRIEAKTQGKLVRWHLEGNDPSADLVVMESTRTVVFCSPQAASFRIVAWTAVGDQPSAPSICQIEVRESRDPFAELRTILRNEPEKGRAGFVAALARVYRRGERFAVSGEYRTMGDLQQALIDQAGRELPVDSLPKLRDHLAVLTSRELSRTAEKLLDAAESEKAAAWFGRVALVLEQESTREAAR